MSHFCAIKKNSNTGIVMRMAAGVRYSQYVCCSAMNVFIPTGSVILSADVMNVLANMNSFQAVINEKNEVTAIPGKESGRTIR